MSRATKEHGEMINVLTGLVRAMAQRAKNNGDNPRAFVEEQVTIYNGLRRDIETERITFGPVRGFLPRMTVELRHDQFHLDGDPIVVFGDGSRRKIPPLE